MGIIYRKKSYIGKDGKSHRAEERVCLICGELFYGINDFKNRKQKYCSKDCWRKRATIINKCLLCGKEVKTYKSVNKKYCGNECRNLHYRERLKGANSHWWRGGKTEKNIKMRRCSKYREWRDSVFERDNWTCQDCKKRGGEIYLNAHHIKQVSTYPELFYKKDNGITLCDVCHHLKHIHKFYGKT